MDKRDLALTAASSQINVLSSYLAIQKAIYNLDTVIKNAQLAKKELEAELANISEQRVAQEKHEDETKRQTFLATRGIEEELPRVVYVKMPQSYYDNAREEELDHNTLEDAKNTLLSYFDDGKARAEAAKLINSLREGDILDTEGYRGVGYFFISRNPKTKKLELNRTDGEYGYYLPKEALPILHKFKLGSGSDIEQVYGTEIFGINLSDDPESEDDFYDFVDKGYDPDEVGRPFRLREHPLKK